MPDTVLKGKGGMAMVYFDKKTINLLVDAFNRRDLEPVTKLFADDVVLHYPGKNRVSGTYQGKQGLLEFWQKQIELTGGSFRGNVISVCQGEGSLILVMETNVDHAGETLSWQRINRYQIADNKIVEAWIFEGDQYAADTVFA
jgi:ketosteroid isomerase-like protein